MPAAWIPPPSAVRAATQPPSTVANPVNATPAAYRGPTSSNPRLVIATAASGYTAARSINRRPASTEFSTTVTLRMNGWEAQLRLVEPREYSNGTNCETTGRGHARDAARHGMSRCVTPRRRMELCHTSAVTDGEACTSSSKGRTAGCVREPRETRAPAFAGRCHACHSPIDGPIPDPLPAGAATGGEACVRQLDPCAIGTTFRTTEHALPHSLRLPPNRSLTPATARDACAPCRSGPFCPIAMSAFTDMRRVLHF